MLGTFTAHEDMFPRRRRGNISSWAVKRYLYFRYFVNILEIIVR